MAIVGFVIAIAIGAGTGFLLYKAEKVGACVLGAVAGVFLGINIYNLFLFSLNNFWLLLLLIILGAVGGVYAASKLHDILLIVSTSLIGSYALVRGISVFAGGFPNEVAIMDELANDIMPTLSTYFYVYFAAIVCLFILGVANQWKHYKGEQSKTNGDF